MYDCDVAAVQAGNASTAAEQDTAASSSALLPPPYESSPASEDVVLHRFSPKCAMQSCMHPKASW